MSTEPTTATVEHEPEANEATPPAFATRYARFGRFQAELERGELYQDGQRVKVQAKVFQGLLLLVSRAGEIVTREEVRRQLWPDSFLANSDANVNTTMNKLRQVLGDSPESPVYIETIPRRGYSFIAGVEYSSEFSAPSAKGAKTILNATSRAGFFGAAWLKNHASTFLRATGLLFAGMIIGALLAFLWFFAQVKTRHSASSAQVSASLTECFSRTASQTGQTSLNAY
jgi:DNA-binding winged helix-turn-helix (wHTH) protein